MSEAGRQLPAGMRGVSQSMVETTTITYSYDPLYRLTAADYDDGTYYHYTYDAVGNRMSQETQDGTSTYAYDDANRLTSVDGVFNATWKLIARWRNLKRLLSR